MANHEYNDAQDNLVLGRALRALRRRAGMTQAELGTRSEIGSTYISQLENGHRGARWHTVRRLLRILDLTLADLAAEVEHQEHA